MMDLYFNILGAIGATAGLIFAISLGVIIVAGFVKCFKDLDENL